MSCFIHFKRIIFVGIIYCCYFTLEAYPYRFQRLILLDKDTKAIKKCVDIIYDIHIVMRDFAKKPSRKKAKMGLLKKKERYILSTAERTLLAALRALNNENEPIDLLWEYVPNSELASITQANFLIYGGLLFSSEFKNKNIIFINSDTYRRNFEILLRVPFYKNMGFTPEFTRIKLSGIQSDLDKFFDSDSPCTSTSKRQFCDLLKIPDPENAHAAKNAWLIYKDFYQKMRTLFSIILKHQPQATLADLINHIEALPKTTQDIIYDSLFDLTATMTDFEFLINILSSKIQHFIVYVGGLHGKRISYQLQKNHNYNLLVDLGSEREVREARERISILPKAWDYLLEKPIKSYNRYKQWGNTPLVNLVEEDSAIWQEFLSLFKIGNSDEEMFKQLQQFFAKAYKTFANFIEARPDHYASKTLLFYAVANGFLTSTEFLLKHGARVNAVDMYNQTPLFYAGPYPAIVKLLLQYQANVTIKNNDGETAIVYLHQLPTTKSESLVLIAEKQLSFLWFRKAKNYVKSFFRAPAPKKISLKKSMHELITELTVLDKVISKNK